MERTTLFRSIPFANLSETHVSASVLFGMIEMSLCKIAHRMDRHEAEPPHQRQDAKTFYAWMSARLIN